MGKERQQPHSNKFMRDYNNLHKDIDSHKHFIPGEPIQPEPPKDIVIKSSRKDLDRKTKDIWDFITGRRTSILDK